MIAAGMSPSGEREANVPKPAGTKNVGQIGAVDKFSEIVTCRSA